MNELIGKYLNGFKIVKIEKDPFVKGQINLWTDDEKSNVFGDRSIVKFFIRDESNTAKVYQELVDKEKHELQQRIDKAIEYIKKHLTDNGRFLMLNEWQVPDLLRILKEVE